MSHEVIDAVDRTTHNYERSGSKWLTLVLLASTPLGHVLIPLALLAGLLGRKGERRNTVESAELHLGPPGGWCFGHRYYPPKNPPPSRPKPKPACPSQPPISREEYEAKIADALAPLRQPWVEGTCVEDPAPQALLPG